MSAVVSVVPIPAEGGRRVQLGTLVGRGGFGEIYRGRMTGSAGLSREVAIKILNADLGPTPELAQRLRDEARLLALLRHRAIVQVEDLLQIHGRWAVVMEYVPGADLTELMALGPMPLRPVCEIAAEVAGALHAAHDATDAQTGASLQIVHRDIKPANIRVGPRGEVKVLDFGIARARLDEGETAAGALAFGSMGYLAPERLDGIDRPEGDIYALAIVVCECLLGERLGQLSTDRARHHAQVEQVLRRLRDPDGLAAPAALVSLIAEALSYNPEGRPSAGRVEDVLQELLLGIPAPWLKRWAPEAQARLREASGRAFEDAPTDKDRPEPSSEDTMGWAPAAVLEEDTDEEPPIRLDRAHIPGAAVRPPPQALQMPVAALSVQAPPPEEIAPPPPARSRAPQWVALMAVLGLVGVAAILALRPGDDATPPRGPASVVETPAAALSAPTATPAPAATPAPTATPAVEPTPPPEAPVAAVPPPAQRPPSRQRPAPVVRAAPAAEPPRVVEPTPPLPVVVVPAAAPLCTVNVVGPVSKVRLSRGDASFSCPSDRVPPGLYDLEATFPSGRTIRRKELVRVSCDGPVTVTCDDIAENCS